MAPFFKRTSNILNAAASYVPHEIAPESPWADTSNLEQITWASLYGDAPLPVNRKTAMSIAAVAKCRNLLSVSVARLPLVAYRNGQELANQPSLLKQIDSGRPNFITITWVVDHLYFYGRAFFVVQSRDSKGQITSMEFITENRVETDDNGNLIRVDGKDVRIQDTFRIDAHNEGLLNFAVDTIREAKSVDRAAANAGENPVPSILLKQISGEDLSGPEVAALLASWRASRAKKGGGVGFANSTLDVVPLGIQPEQLLIDARNAAALNIARASGMPAWAVDAAVSGTSLTYETVESRNRELIDYALMPYLETIEGHLTSLLPAGQTVKFDTDELLRADLKGRLEAYKLAIEAGIYTVEEVRRSENLPELPEAVVADITTSTPTQENS